MATSEDCFFYELYKCEKKKEKLQNSYRTRIENIIICSKQLNDNYHLKLESLLVSEPANPSIKVHKSCVSRYTSPTNVQAHVAHIRKKSCVTDDSEQSVPKRLRSSVGEQFDFQKHCLFCPDITICLLASECDSKIAK